MLIRVDEKFRPFMNGLPEIEINCATVAEGIRKWLNRFPQLHVHLLDNQGKVALDSYFLLDGVHTYRLDDAHVAVQEDTLLELKGDLPAGESAVIRIIVSVIVLIVGVILMFVPGCQLLGMMLIMYGGQGIAGEGIIGNIQAIINGIHAPDANYAIDGSSVYTFSGVRNTTASGTPLNIVYGEHRCGGHVLNMYTRTTDAAQDGSVEAEILYVQLGLSEGEIEGVRNIEVNQLPTTFYNAIEYDMSCKGTPYQDLMPNFTRVENTTTDGRKVTCLYDSSGGRVDFGSPAQDQLFNSIVSPTPVPVCGVLEYRSGKYQALLGNYTL